MRALFRKMTFVLLLTSGTADAAEWKVDPTLKFRAGYNDNLRLSTDNEVSTAVAAFSPGAIFSVTTPASGASGTLNFDFRRFEDDSNLNDDNVRFKVNTFRILERSRIGLEAGFVRDTTLDSQLEATGLAFARIRRHSISASPNWSYNINQRTRLSANYRYREVEYKNAGGTGFTNFNVHSGQASITRIVNDRTTATVTLSRSMSDNDNDVESTNTSLQGGASYRFSETLSASLFAGVRRTETDFSQTSLIPIFAGDTIIGFIPLSESATNSDSGSTFSASIDKAFSRGGASVSATRDIRGDINGQPVEVTRLRVNGTYRHSGTLRSSLTLDGYHSESKNTQGASIERDYYQIEPRLSWDIQQFWSLSGSYRYRKQTFDNTSDDATQNAAYLTLTYLWPRIAVSR